MYYPQTKEEVRWNLSLESEFAGPRQAGYTFVIDVLDSAARLALYHMKQNYSQSTTLDTQPPGDILLKALREQGISPHQDGLYPINREIRSWIEDTMF